jgi:hypothetical protein
MCLLHKAIPHDNYKSRASYIKLFHMTITSHVPLTQSYSTWQLQVMCLLHKVMTIQDSFGILDYDYIMIRLDITVSEKMKGPGGSMS